MRRSEDADIHLSRTGFSQARNFFFLKDPEQTGLDRSRDVSNFIQEQRAAVSRFKESMVIVDRAGEGASLVAKQLAAQQ